MIRGAGVASDQGRVSAAKRAVGVLTRQENRRFGKEPTGKDVKESAVKEPLEKEPLVIKDIKEPLGKEPTSPFEKSRRRRSPRSQSIAVGAVKAAQPAAKFAPRSALVSLDMTEQATASQVVSDEGSDRSIWCSKAESAPPRDTATSEPEYIDASQAAAQAQQHRDAVRAAAIQATVQAASGPALTDWAAVVAAASQRGETKIVRWLQQVGVSLDICSSNASARTKGLPF